MQFSKSKVEYATHQLSLYHGECPHNCSYCFVKMYRKRNWEWATGSLRRNHKAKELAKKASVSGVECLVISFTNDALPYSSNIREMKKRMWYLIGIMEILEARKIPTKILTKNAMINQLTEHTAPYKYIQIGLSITGNIDGWDNATKYEKYSSTNQMRFKTLKTLSNKGFRTWVSLEPILPQTDIEQLIKKITWGNRINEIWIGKPNYHQELIKAFCWSDVAKLAVFYQKKNPQLHIKSELLEYVK